MMGYIKAKRDDGSYYCDSKKTMETIALLKTNTKKLKKCSMLFLQFNEVFPGYKHFKIKTYLMLNRKY